MFARVLFEPFEINGVEFANRILRSSVGGRTANYDGTVTSVWKNFERRFADGGIGGIISTTLNVNPTRKSPLEYPPISEDRYVEPLRRAIAEIRSTGCRYIIQIGDPGSATQTSLFAEDADAQSASRGLDLIYGYRSVSTALTEDEIGVAIREFADAAARVRATGADGLEVTASKGYLIHQFLNPGINRRRDRWGGSRENRARFLEEVVKAVRAAVGTDFLFGIRLAAADYNYLPVNLRLPLVLPLRHYVYGNQLEDTLYYGARLKQLGVDFFHIDSGYGFIHPRVTPGRFPFEEARLFFDTTRHLGIKSSARSTLMHLLPTPLGRRLFGIGWRYEEGINLEYAQRFREDIGLPVIVSGGFQNRPAIDAALEQGRCDLVAIARGLIANPDLLEQFKSGRDSPAIPCTHCNRCAARTATSPLGCYDQSRFSSQKEMQTQILAWNHPDD